MSVTAGRMTVEEFEKVALLPENADRRLEYVGGEVVEVGSNNSSSLVAVRIAAQLLTFVEQHTPGFVTGADGGYIVSGERYIPDVAFTSRDRQPSPSRAAWNPEPPDLAVEVLSPSDDPDVLRIKVGNYLSAGTVVWVVNPDRQRVEIYAPGQPVQKVSAGETLEGGAVLPGFSLAVESIFPE